VNKNFAISLLSLFACLQIANASNEFSAKDWANKRIILAREAERLQGAYEESRAAVVSPAIDITVPVERHPNGALKFGIKAHKAFFILEKGFVYAEGIVASQYDSSGKLIASIKAESCVIDRETKSGWAKGRVVAQYGATKVEGDDVYFSSPEEYISVNRNSKVVSSDLDFKGVKL
jgi:lipopolysaccharide assembly outer membrane protein LptD (OstA)